MSPKQTYELYLAIKLHFTSDYNFHKYNGKVPPKVVDSLSKKGGMKYSVERLGKHKDVKGFVLSNILQDPDWTPFKYKDDRSKDVYNNWKRNTDALQYKFKEDLGRLIEDFDSNFQCTTRPPSLLNSYVAGFVSAETVAILLSLTGAGKIWIESLQKTEHPYAQIAFRLNKYASFLDCNMNIYRDIVKDRFQTEKKVA